MRYGAIQLNRPISSARSVFQRTFETRVADIPCTLYTPSLVASPSGPTEQVGPPPGDMWPTNIDWWGNAGQKGAPQALLKSLGIAIDDNTSFREVTATTTGISEWERLLFDWLSVLVNKPIELISTSSAVLSWCDYPSDLFPAWSNQQRPHVVNNPGIANEHHWAQALDHAGNGDEAPPSRVLLVEAFRALESMRWRPTIFDCSTATELALTRGIYDELRKSATHDEAEGKLKKTRMLGPLTDLARNLGLKLPKGIKQDLIDVRNRAMHRGTRIDQSEAVAAWITAHEVVEQYEPLAP